MKNLFCKVIPLVLMPMLVVVPSTSNADGFAITALPVGESGQSFDYFSAVNQNGGIVGADAEGFNYAETLTSGLYWKDLPIAAAYAGITGVQGFPTSISADGRIMAGFTGEDSNDLFACYWNQNGAEQFFPLGPGMDGDYVSIGLLNFANIPQISGDASTLVGTQYDDYGYYHALTFNLATKAWTDVGALDGNNPYSYSSCISFDGSAVCGESYVGASNSYDGFVWTARSGIQDLGTPLSYTSAEFVYPTCMNQDGSILYGDFKDGSTGQYHAFRWTQLTGVVEIGTFFPTSCSLDGSVVVGVDANSSNDIIYSPSLGAQNLLSFLQSNGVTTSFVAIQNGSRPKISGDGMAIYCTGFTSGGTSSNIKVTLPAMQSWDAAKDFSISSNPNGLWSYGVLNSGAFYRLPNSGEGNVGLGDFEYWYGNTGTIYLNVSSYNQFGIDPGAISVDADSGNSVTRWTAPYTGTFNVNLQYGTVDGSSNGAGNADVGNGQLLINGVAQPYTSYTSTKVFRLQNVPLHAGDTLDAVVYEHYGSGNTNTVFSVSSFTGPQLNSLVPDSRVAGDTHFSVTVNGSGFVSGSTVRWNGVPLAIESLSPTQIKVEVRASFIASVGTALITVTAPNGAVTNAEAFKIYSLNPQPVAQSVSPNQVQSGGAAFTLTVLGTGFTPDSFVEWNGRILPTTFVSATELQAAVSAPRIAHAGTATVLVGTPKPGGGDSATISIAIH